MCIHCIGDITVRKVVEQKGAGFTPEALFPEWEPSLLETYRDLMIPDCFDPAQGRFIASIHTWVVHIDNKIVLIDSCGGNHKERPSAPRFHRQNLPFLQRLAEAGVQPEDVDYVICTHLHADHCGWNTKLVDGRWVPTFPNAVYVFSKKEYDHWAGPAGNTGFNAGVFADSVLPVVESGQALMVGDDAEILPGLSLHSTPGHSVGHMAVHISSKGELGIFSGDIMHQPLQIFRPAWNTVFCEHPEDARAVRQRLLEEAADRAAVIFTAHFANTSAGRVVRHGDGFDWFFV
ncbi:MBL fold metallo-hydrolase [Rhizobium sp. 16-449-1b]|uniref:MBL fold metallo-hydrolase n=1 Tax=Rhizobium sp. 16-449-1b TaxID=2819989 RepID=UPI001ADBBC03|nr:MBL fold metallo-hydrolase [Rhizobium sp. 16-449-1b]MBO9195933.1 MBL fold metallo-hydrolase [Rhizobium sp. 16-449-1b]